jgi:uncharacterized membrane protein
VAAVWEPQQVYRDGQGAIRLVTVPVSYERLVDHAFHKIRQAGRGIPAVMIRQAEMIKAAAQDAVPDEPDRVDVMRSYDAFVDAYAGKVEP